MSKFNKQKYDNEYAKQNYDRCIFNVPKGQKTVIEEYWKSKGYKSLNNYINHLIKKDMEEEKMKLSSKEEIILNRYRYGTEQDKKDIWNLIMEIDARHTQDEKKQLFEKYQKEIKVKNNSGIIVGDNNGIINM